jgi:flagellar capping protein FliD
LEPSHDRLQAIEDKLTDLSNQVEGLQTSSDTRYRQIMAQFTAISVEIGSMTALQEATLNTLRAINTRLQLLERKRSQGYPEAQSSLP